MRGSDAASPQTSSTRPWARAASPDAGDLREHPRVVGGHLAGGEAVDAEHVRGEVVRADREEVRGRGDLVHPRRPRPPSRSSPRAAPWCEGADGLDVGGVADQREQHADALRRRRSRAVARPARRARSSSSAMPRALMPRRNGGVLSPPKSSTRTVAVRPPSERQHGFEHPPVRGLVGPGRGVQERELGPQQAHALRAGRERDPHLGRAGGVGQDADADAVAGDGGAGRGRRRAASGGRCARDRRSRPRGRRRPRAPCRRRAPAAARPRPRPSAARARARSPPRAPTRRPRRARCPPRARRARPRRPGRGPARPG